MSTAAMSTTRARRHALLPLLLAALVAALLAAPAAGQAGEAEAAAPEAAPTAFSHPVHLEMELECKNCHLGEDGTAPLRPTNETCLECHGEGEVSVPIATVSAHAREWVFPHETHVDALGDCTACHDPAQPTPKAQLAMQDCMDCHGGAVATSCGDCHTRLDRDVAPGPGSSPLIDHSQAWRMRHGENSKLAQDTCTLCHQVPNDCQSCHLDTPPRSHTASFKLKTHGVEAELDRQACQSCHVDSSFCAECHQDTRPQSHTPAWGRLGDQHCGSCHLPLADTTCATCHTQADLAVHLEAPPPATHDVTWGGRLNRHCNDCHLPLADNDCALCHRDLSAHETPPPSHDAGFNRSPTFGHCNDCHFPLAELEESCAVCHRSGEHQSSPTMPEWHDGVSDCLYCHPSSEPTNHPLTDMETCLQCHRPN